MLILDSLIVESMQSYTKKDHPKLAGIRPFSGYFKRSVNHAKLIHFVKARGDKKIITKLNCTGLQWNSLKL